MLKQQSQRACGNAREPPIKKRYVSLFVEIPHVRACCREFENCANSYKILLKMGKIKQEPVDQEDVDTSVKTEPQNHDDKVSHCSVIAKPMASKKLSKKIYKLIKKSSSHKNYIRNGLKIVQKQLRLGEKGIVVFAGDISPIEIMCHLPAVCEEKDVPYCYTPSRKDIGSAMGTMRGCIMVLVKEHSEYKDLYDEVKSEIKLLGHPL